MSRINELLIDQIYTFQDTVLPLFHSNFLRKSVTYNLLISTYLSKSLALFYLNTNYKGFNEFILNLINLTYQTKLNSIEEVFNVFNIKNQTDLINLFNDLINELKNQTDLHCKYISLLYEILFTLKDYNLCVDIKNILFTHIYEMGYPDQIYHLEYGSFNIADNPNFNSIVSKINYKFYLNIIMSNKNNLNLLGFTNCYNIWIMDYLLSNKTIIENNQNNIDDFIEKISDKFLISKQSDGTYKVLRYMRNLLTYQLFKDEHDIPF